MNNRGFLGIIGTIFAVIIIGFIVFYFVNRSSGDTTSENNLIETNVIHITEQGFSPKELTIKKGESVTWINDRTAAAWPASARHPTHTQYPGVDYDLEGTYMGSKACISEGEAKEGAFDPCKGLNKGESWTFTFIQNGSFGYHDHINAGFTGRITVEN